ncbi:hypothetical protein [Conyzicola sp.]|uniref:hypothetical protein n=1 Tax=Conyzicola sp. TaxID=1969404 RepID=UPI0039895347
MELLPGFLALAFALVFLAAGATRWKGFAATSRLALVTAALDAVAMLALAHALMPWGSVPTWLWLLPVAVAAAGVAAAVLRWQRLPVLRTDKPRARTIVFAVLHVVVIVAFVALFLG